MGNKKIMKNGGDVSTSKPFKVWKRHKKLKIALTSVIGISTLSGGLVGGFAWRASAVVPTLSASITENNLQFNQNDSFAILKITETNKDHWIEPKIDLGESGLLIESHLLNEQMHTKTYKISLGDANDGVYDITISLEEFETVTVSVSVIPAKEITASIDGPLHYLDNNEEVKITVTTHNNASLPTSTLELDGFKFTPFVPVNDSLKAETTVSWNGASMGDYELTITNGSEITTINISVIASINLSATLTNDSLQIGTNGTATLTVNESGIDSWVLPTVEASTGANLSLPTSAADWTVTGTTAYATISLTPATIAGTYTITVKNSQFSSDATTSLKVSPQKSLKAELMQNDLRVGVTTGEAIIQVTEENTTTWVDPTISSTDLTDAGLSFDGNWTTVEGKPYTKTAIIQNSDAIVGSHDLAVTAKDADGFDFLSTSVNICVMAQETLITKITDNNLQYGATGTTATLTVTESGASSWIDPIVTSQPSGLVLPTLSSDWTDTTDPLTKTATIGLGSALAGHYTILTEVGSSSLSQTTSLDVLENKILKIDVISNNLKIGNLDSQAQIKVTPLNAMIASSDLQVIDLPSWLSVDNWNADGSSFSTTVYFSGSGTPISGEVSFTIGSTGFTSGSVSLIVLPVQEFALQTMISSNNLKVDDGNSSAVINVKGVNVASLDNQPQITGLPTGLSATWTHSTTDLTLWVCTIVVNDVNTFATVGDFLVTFSANNVSKTEILTSENFYDFEIIGPNELWDWEGCQSNTLTYQVDVSGGEWTWKQDNPNIQITEDPSDDTKIYVNYDNLPKTSPTAYDIYTFQLTYTIGHAKKTLVVYIKIYPINTGGA